MSRLLMLQVVADTMRQKEEAEQKVAAIAEKIQQMSQLAV